MVWVSANVRWPDDVNLWRNKHRRIERESHGIGGLGGRTHAAACGALALDTQHWPPSHFGAAVVLCLHVRSGELALQLDQAAAGCESGHGLLSPARTVALLTSQRGCGWQGMVLSQRSRRNKSQQNNQNFQHKHGVLC